jgi:hypothetical protein
MRKKIEGPGGFVGKIKDAPPAACVAWRGIAKQTERR